MKVLFEPDTLIIKILGEQKIKPQISYRPFFYVKSLPIEDGILLLNLLTYELVFLNSDEMYFYQTQNSTENETVKQLISKWFLVPLSQSDIALIEQCENMKNLTNRSLFNGKYHTFTILSTTDCNARCFYCFEHGTKKRDMSEQTAADVADYIINNKKDSNVFLRWFGGEPLYNSKAIDIICSRLQKANVEYKSKMITNGYLFDEVTVNKAIKLWKLKEVQITLDGTEEKYNRIKNYIYRNENAYLKVMHNIGLLLRADITVKIRMNMDQYNIDDLYRLTDELLSRFGKQKNFYMYSALIFEESCAHMKNIGTEERRLLLEKQAKLEAYILNRGKYALDSEIHKNRFGHCMADDNYSVMILPDGNLGKCQSLTENGFIGNIYKSEIDFKILNSYFGTKTVSTSCNECIYRLACVFPKCCIMSLKNCTELDKKLIDTRLSNQMLKCYEKFKHENI